MPADSRVEVDPDGVKVSVSQVLRAPVGLPGAHLAQGALEQTRFLFLGLQSRSVFVPQEGGSWKPRKSWTLEFKVNLATLLSRDFGQDSPAL